METVRALSGLRGAERNQTGIPLAPVPADKAYFPMCSKPFDYILTIPAAKHRQGLPRVKIHDSAHVCISFEICKIVDGNVSACLYIRILNAHATSPAYAGALANGDVLPGQRLACKTSRLV